MTSLELLSLPTSIFTLPNNDGFPGIFPAPSFGDYLEDLIHFLRTHLPYAQDNYQTFVNKYLVAEATLFYLFLIVALHRFRLAQIYLLIKVPTFAVLFLSSGTSYLNLLAWILCPLAYPVELLVAFFVSFWAFHRSSLARIDKTFGGVPEWEQKLVAVKKKNGGMRWKKVDYVRHIWSPFYTDRLFYHAAFTCFYAYAKYRMILGNPLAGLLQLDLQDDLDNVFFIQGMTYAEEDNGTIYTATVTTDAMDTLYYSAARLYPIIREFHKRDSVEHQYLRTHSKWHAYGGEWETLDRILNFPTTTLFGVKLPWTARHERVQKELTERWLSRPDTRPFEWVTDTTPKPQSIVNYIMHKKETSEQRALRLIRRNLYRKTEAGIHVPAPNLRGLGQRIIENLSTEQFTVTREAVLAQGNRLHSGSGRNSFPIPTWRYRFREEHIARVTSPVLIPTWNPKNRHATETVAQWKAGIGWTQVKPALVRSKSFFSPSSVFQRSTKPFPLRKTAAPFTKVKSSWEKKYVEPEIRTGFTGFNFEQFAPLMELDSISNLRYGLLFILALSSLTVYSIILAGWSSNSKYAFLGALRSAAQMISYEVSISLALLPVILLAGSLNLTAIVYGQTETVWYLFPLLPIALVFLVSMLAETNRTPFDLPEAEAELVAGYNVDYSSLPFAMFFLGEYSNMILISVLFCLLFLGGWDGAVIALQEPYVLTLKAAVVWVFFVIVRATLPRYRYDQLMDIGWKAFLPFAGSFLVFVIGLVIFLDAAPVVEEVALEDLYGAPAAFIAENAPAALVTPQPLTELPVTAFQPPPEISEPKVWDLPPLLP